MAAIVGGGRGAKPGEISLAHHGVLFLDELPEFPRTVLETLRQPIETGDVVVARANAHVRYPCRFMLVAAANPCRCGHLADPARACARVPDCGADYLGRISGPLMDRFDLRVEVPPVTVEDLGAAGAPARPAPPSPARVARARAVQRARFAGHEGVAVNADAEGDLLEAVAGAERGARRRWSARSPRKFRLSARGLSPRAARRAHHRRPRGLRAGREARTSPRPPATGWRSEAFAPALRRASAVTSILPAPCGRASRARRNAAARSSARSASGSWPW